MQNHRIRFSSKHDVRSQKSHYTNVSKIDSSKNVELSLEVELDDEVRSIIKDPDKCASALLDVTVIKPRGLDQYTTKTQTLKTDQVKKLIESVKLDEADKKKLMQKLFGITGISNEKISTATEKKRKSCLSSKKSKLKQSKLASEHGDVCNTRNQNTSAVFSVYNLQQNPLKQQIYATPKTYENIREMLECKNKHRRREEDGKTDEPCLCQNCAIVGVLADSQKRPFATEPIPANVIEEKFDKERESRFRNSIRRKSVSFKQLEDLPSSSKSHDQCQAIFKLLSERIVDLEKRVIKQEERAVPKDYFKKIITKLVNHLSKLTHYTTEERNNMMPHRDKDPYYDSRHKPERHNRYHVNPVLIETRPKFTAEKEFEPKLSSSEEPPRGATESVWKWGEDFWSTGRDLKNKVVLLLEETLQQLKKGWERSQNNRQVDNDDIQLIVDELSKNLAQTVQANSRSRPNEDKLTPRRSSKSNKSDKSKLTRKCAKPSLIPRYKSYDPGIDVAYINPKMMKWPEDSAVSFRIESDYESQEVYNMSKAKRRQYKSEFLRVLENTKITDKYKLWQNIWNQALENRQNKNDTVTIQIPDPNDLLRQKMIHLEYTIGELERLLIKNHK